MLSFLGEGCSEGVVLGARGAATWARWAPRLHCEKTSRKLSVLKTKIIVGVPPLTAA
jgi:hypothetical protein